MIISLSIANFKYSLKFNLCIKIGNQFSLITFKLFSDIDNFINANPCTSIIVYTHSHLYQYISVNVLSKLKINLSIVPDALNAYGSFHLSLDKSSLFQS